LRFLNVSDAVKGRENARVELAGFLDERGRPVIQVRDNGVGIPEESLDKIFWTSRASKPRRPPQPFSG